MSSTSRLERFANAIPHPFFLFLSLCLLTLLGSWLGSCLLSPVVLPQSDQPIVVKSLVSADGLRYILTHTVKNFVTFQPLGVVLCMMLAIGLVQETGLAQAAIRHTLLSAPARLVTATIFFVGIIGNIASEAAFVLIPPIAAIIFIATGRHPVIGIAAGFVAVAAGFTANVFIASTDVLLAGITTEATKAIAYTVVPPTANWLFMLISVPILVLMGVVVTDYYIEPRYRHLPLHSHIQPEPTHYQTSPREKKALQRTLWVACLYITIWVALLWSPDSPIRGEGGTIIPSPFMTGLIPILMMFFVVCALVYGFHAGTLRTLDDIPKALAAALQGIGQYIVLVFVIAQFIAWFHWSNLATVMAVHGAEWLSEWQLPKVWMLIVFMLLSAAVNMIIYSGSAQWSIMAPVFVPLFMLLGIAPADTQMAYRIADSTTNIIAPTNIYIPMLMALIAQYSPTRFGTFMVMMVPYVCVFFFGWSAIFLVYWSFGWPLGF